MAIDRSKFKASSVSKMQEKDGQLGDMMGRKSNRAGMLDITTGKNIFRIYPGHPEESMNDDDQPGFSQPSVKTFLPMMVDEKDKEGKLTGQKKESSRPVFNSRVHGSTPKDLVEEYIKFARKIAEQKWPDAADKDTKQKYLDKVYGKYSDNPAQRQMGINYKTAHVMYADKIVGETRTFGRLEVKDSVKVNMNAIAATEAEGEAMGIDPFTDLDDGRAIVIIYDKTAKPATNVYKTNLDSDIDKATKMAKFYPIDDERLEEFGKQPTLLSMYVKVFTRKDFELQMEGLQFFDKKHNMGIFEKDEWLDVVEEIDTYYPETKDGKETKAAPIAKAAKVEVEEEDEEIDEAEAEGDEFSAMSRIQLKTYIAKNQLGIVIKPSFSENAIRDLIRESIGVETEEVEEVEEINDLDETFKEEPKTEVRATSRLAGLRKK